MEIPVDWTQFGTQILSTWFIEPIIGSVMKTLVSARTSVLVAVLQGFDAFPDFPAYKVGLRAA
jgi:hypothetical protein